MNFNEPSEPITILLSRQGWIKTLKGHGHNINDIKFKDGDEFLIYIEVISDGKSLIFSSNGKFYTVENNQLPSGRGYGDPLSSIIDLQDGDNIVSLHPYDQNFEVLIASKKGYGFIASSKDLLSNRKAGKQIMNLTNDDEAVSSDIINGSHVAVIGENKKMLLFAKEELPKMSKGKGVRLQKYKEGNLTRAISFEFEKGLNIMDKNGRKRCFNDIDIWLGKRGQAGKKVPKGFPRNF